VHYSAVDRTEFPVFGCLSVCFSMHLSFSVCLPVLVAIVDVYRSASSCPAYDTPLNRPLDLTGRVHTAQPVKYVCVDGSSFHTRSCYISCK